MCPRSFHTQPEAPFGVVHCVVNFEWSYQFAYVPPVAIAVLSRTEFATQYPAASYAPFTSVLFSAHAASFAVLFPARPASFRA
eukprot:31277-Pelagococcus_subviridis.AAC.2